MEICIPISSRKGRCWLWGFICYLSVNGNSLWIWILHSETEIWICFIFPATYLNVLTFALEISWMLLICPVKQCLTIFIRNWLLAIDLMAIEVSSICCWVWINAQQMVWPWYHGWVICSSILETIDNISRGCHYQWGIPNVIPDVGYHIMTVVVGSTNEWISSLPCCCF